MKIFDIPQVTKTHKRVVAMAFSNYKQNASKLFGLLTVALFLAASLASQAHAADVVTTYKDDSGWKLQVNGNDFYAKGVVWGYSPRGQNYSYNLWAESDDNIRKVLDYDFSLLKAANVNSIRSFAMIPPKWVTYIYKEHGIMTVVNPLMGRYGYMIGGKWVPFTDYSDPLTRATLKADMLELINQYKDTPGVLMFAFGNESNYGLSWSSFEIENLPEGEQNTAKARYLYSLFNEVIKDGKTIAPHVPFTIVNGDIQYIDLIAELVPDLDILGSNVYRGPSFTTLWKDVDEKLDLPVMFFEFGSDAFNARDYREDQLSQARILKDQWQEMYNKSYGNGEEGNSIGGFVFEWRDEWWKYLQEENLDTQDNNASWSNQAYLFDWAEGQNNMNEEWFGIAALGKQNADGVYTARPRMAYDVLAEIWGMDPYLNKKAAFNQGINNINMDYLELKGEVRQLKSENEEQKAKLTFTGGRIQGELVTRGTDESVRVNGENGVEFSDGQMVFLDFAFQPTQNVEGQFSLNILGNVADKRPLEFTYGDRGLPVTVFTVGELDGNEFIRETELSSGERVEIYDFEATYQGDNFDLTGFYHTPRFHWGYEGDFFGLVHEATDIYGMDIWNAKAPEGLEIQGKNKWKNLRVLMGPEVYWGANPKFIVKYDFNLAKFDWTFIHSEDVARSGEGASATQATERQSRQTTLFAEREFGNGWKLELGGIMSAYEKVDDVYTRIDGSGNIILDQIDFEDTLGFKAKLTMPLLGTETYVQAHHAGLVADGGQVHKVFGINDPSRLPYSGLGNKREYEAGTIMNFGNLMVFPRLMYRDNLVDANPFLEASIGPGGVLNPGLNPRDRDSDPFAVLGNREARSAEVVFKWDPTGASEFYRWDNDWREDARFAFDFGASYTEFPTFTDANLFFLEPLGVNASFGQGLPAEDIWTVSSRMVFNPKPGQKYITRLVRGFDQSTGNPEGGTRDYWQLHWKAIFGGRHTFSGFFMKDAWGPYDFYRQFNVTYPEQVKLDYSILLGGNAGSFVSAQGENEATRIGIRTLYRSGNAESDLDPLIDGDYIFMTVLYFTYQF
jgi:beta-galactosidase